MRHTRTIILLFLTCFAASVHAEWVDRSGGKLPESGYRKSQGSFVAQMVFVLDDQELLRAWSIPGESVNVNDVDTVSVNSPISAFVVFGGCKPNASGNCDVVMLFRVIDPDGKLYAQTPPMEVWSGKPTPPGGALQLSVEYLKIIVEPNETAGRYVVHTEVRDRNSGGAVSLQKAFTASKIGIR